MAGFSVVFVHGLARKPSPTELLKLWLWGLSRGNPRPDAFAPPNLGINLKLGTPNRLNYYADVFYGEDYETDLGSYQEAVGDTPELVNEGLADADPGEPLPTPVTPREVAFVEAIERKLAAYVGLEAGADADEMEAQGTPHELARLLPKRAREEIIRKFAMEAFYFLFDKEFVRKDGARFRVRQELRNRLLDDLKTASTGGREVVLLSHSMGTMVAYDVLRNVPACPPVHTLFTMGSPLGIREVQDELVAVDARRVDFPAAKLGHWYNVYDPLDPVCGADPRFANDFRPVDGKTVVDVKESNWGNWRHTITHYLAGEKLRNLLATTISVARS